MRPTRVLETRVVRMLVLLTVGTASGARGQTAVPDEIYRWLAPDAAAQTS